MVSSQEGNFAVDVGTIGDINAKTSLARDFSFVLLAIHSYDSWASLNIVTSAFAKVVLITDVKISNRSVEVVAGIANVSFSVDVRTSKCCGCGQDRSGCSEK